MNPHKPARRGIVAAGHRETASAALEVLSLGGNAFDAAVAAMLTACVAEPVLASPGGGGFLTAHPREQSPRVYDFFAHTPRRKQHRDRLDFHPIEANFGTTRQTFHIGLGAIATPGFVSGLFAIHRDLCQLPLEALFEPAIQRARNGVTVNPFQHLINRIVAPILLASPASRALHSAPGAPDMLISQGDCHRLPDMADFLDTLQREGERFFYAGEPARNLIMDSMQNGGQLTQEDLDGYRVNVRQPLRFAYRSAELITNPLPSLGGTLIAFSLGLLDNRTETRAGAASETELRQLARAMRITLAARSEQHDQLEQLLAPGAAEQYKELMQHGGLSTRGTTQISIADAQGNLASLTLSNGEGCGYVIPHTGIMMNNMLGEEDLNPGGFQRWTENRRLLSMMTPTLVMSRDGDALVTGSGGSNRIRSAILQVILNHLDHGLSLQQAVSHPRIHYEDGQLSIEPGIDKDICRHLEDEFPQQQHWQEKSLFFGGAHSVLVDRHGGLHGAADERRGGVCLTID
ncbi:MAG: gamma-glutamyltransferase [Candidatus Thiodiazotropha sp.]